MTPYEEHCAKIAKVKNELLTASGFHKRDLQKHLNRLYKEKYQYIALRGNLCHKTTV